MARAMGIDRFGRALGDATATVSVERSAPPRFSDDRVPLYSKLHLQGCPIA